MSQIIFQTSLLAHRWVAQVNPPVSKDSFTAVINGFKSSHAWVGHLCLQLIIDGPRAFQPFSGCGQRVLHSHDSLHLPDEKHIVFLKQQFKNTDSFIVLC